MNYLQGKFLVKDLLRIVKNQENSEKKGPRGTLRDPLQPFLGPYKVKKCENCLKGEFDLISISIYPFMCIYVSICFSLSPEFVLVYIC